jgi:hypothetical protein
MWLVLAEPADTGAAWAAAGLRRRGLQPTQLVTSDELARVAGWRHRIGVGPASVEIQLHDGRRLSSTDVQGTLNRLVLPPAAAVAGVEAADRDYATGELFAFYVSWLHALPGPILNPPSALGLSGRWRSGLEWAALAGRAGIEARNPPRRPASGEDTATVTIAADRALGAPVPEPVAQACRELATLSDTPLLAVQLVRDAESWEFCAATPWPDLTAAGEPLLDALAQALDPARA